MIKVRFSALQKQFTIPKTTLLMDHTCQKMPSGFG